jgi:hypothetical protein
MTTTAIKRFTLEQFNTISFNGFDFTIPTETHDMINYLTNEVGCPSYVKTPVFHKKNDTNSSVSGSGSGSGSGGEMHKNNPKGKRKGNKNMEISNDEWESIRNFQATKLEEKTGLDSDIDQIRLHLNKITDKTVTDMKDKLIVIINNLYTSGLDYESMEKISKTIYDISSSNKFYSKIYADVYSELVNKYDWLRTLFDAKVKSFIDEFANIEFCDPDKDYNKFCDMNKMNEQRKATTQFYMNLHRNGFIPAHIMTQYLQILLERVRDMIEQNDKKNEVDELTENIAIMFDKNMIENAEDETNDEYNVGDISINEFITKLAKSKTKDYKSLSNKAIFKYMDLVDL